MKGIELYANVKNLQDNKICIVAIEFKLNMSFDKEACTSP